MLRIVHIVLPKYNVMALHIEAVVISEAIGREWYEVCRHRVSHFEMLIPIGLFQAIGNSFSRSITSVIEICLASILFSSFHYCKISELYAIRQTFIYFFVSVLRMVCTLSCYTA